MAEQGRTIIVGAGIAGLICAIELTRAGREVVLLEREGEVGGRVRTVREHGFTFDRGFQVLFTAYPVLRDYLDVAALRPRPFLPAARIALAGRTSLVGDALRQPALLLDTIGSRELSTADKLRLLRLRLAAATIPVEQCFAPRYRAMTARALLVERGFSPATIAHFFEPFYGGILLDRSLTTSAAILLFTFKMLAEGETVLPADGIDAIPRQLAAALPDGCLRTKVEVAGPLITDGLTTGVRLTSGEPLDAAHVVLATEPPTIARLGAAAGVDIPVPDGALGCTTLYFAADETPLDGRALWLNADRDPVISHAVTVSQVAPEYAPAGRHLLAATALGEGAILDDRTIETRARADLAAMRGDSLPPMELVHIARVPYAQFPQPPDESDANPSPRTNIANLLIASELLHSSSLDGAARGGRAAARAILRS